MAYEEVRYRWTGEDWSEAARAKKAKDDGTDPPPKILVTPYGLSPTEFHTAGVEGGQVVIKSRVYLASDTEEKKPVAAWDITAGAEVMLPLELAELGERWYRDRFYKKEQVWIPRPDGVTGSTLVELCQALYGTGQPQLDVYHYFSDTKPENGRRVSKTPQDVALDTPVRERVMSKLVGHWKNTQYHYEQVRQGYLVNGSLPATLKSESGADVTLEVVMAEPPPPAAAKPVAPQGAAGGIGSGAVVAVDMRPAGGSPPPPPFDKLPEPLKVTLVQSYQERKAGTPGAEKALGDSFNKGANVWEVLSKGFDWQDINTMVRVYQRIEAIDKTGALWRDHVKYLVRAYTGGIYALEMIYTDRDKLRIYLDSDVIHRDDLPKLARGVKWTQQEHTGTDGWREVSDTDQLHIDIANVPGYSKAEDIHIDETSFTCGRDEDGNSVQAWTSGPRHWLQSQDKSIPIERPFANLEAILNDMDKNRPLLTAETAAALKEWAERRDAESVSGEPGHKKAVDLWHHVNSECSLPERNFVEDTDPYAP